MRKVRFHVFLVALSCALSAFNVCAQPITLSKQTIEIQTALERCSERFGNDACLGFPARDHVAVYKEPNISSQVIQYVPFNSYIGLLEPKESAKYLGWVSVASSSKNELLRGWMRHDDVVLASDLRRVIDCWPVEALNWDEEDEGDFAGGKYRLKFDKTGKIRPRIVDGRVVDFDTKHFAIYYARGGFLVAPHTDKNIERFTPFFMLDYASKKLTIPFPAKKPSARFFREEELEGCKNIPTVDANVAMKFR